MKLYVKRIIICCLRMLYRIFYLFPVKPQRIFFSSYKGEGMCCNPYYIYQYLQEHEAGKFECVWEIQEGGLKKNGTYICVRPHTLKDLYYKMTAGVLISNIGFSSTLPKRKNQCYINTWHGGGAYKKVGVDLKEEQHPINLFINRLCAKQLDYFISSSETFTDCMSAAKLIPKDKFFVAGQPRNDIFFKRDEVYCKKLRQRFNRTYNVSENKKLVLYAPTYRDKETKENEQLKVSGVLDSLKKRFGGEWQMLIRAHHFSKGWEWEDTVNVSTYPDMQELLLISDVLITDFSSCMWDFALTGKPGFLFVPDLISYRKERELYTPIETWPFSYATSNEELCSLMNEYDEKQAKEKIRRHLQSMGSCEQGQACERIVRTLLER